MKEQQLAQSQQPNIKYTHHKVTSKRRDAKEMPLQKQLTQQDTNSKSSSVYYQPISGYYSNYATATSPRPSSRAKNNCQTSRPIISNESVKSPRHKSPAIRSSKYLKAANAVETPTESTPTPQYNFQDKASELLLSRIEILEQRLDSKDLEYSLAQQNLASENDRLRSQMETQESNFSHILQIVLQNQQELEKTFSSQMEVLEGRLKSLESQIDQGRENTSLQTVYEERCRPEKKSASTKKKGIQSKARRETSPLVVKLNLPDATARDPAKSTRNSKPNPESAFKQPEQSDVQYQSIKVKSQKLNKLINSQPANTPKEPVKADPESQNQFNNSISSDDMSIQISHVQGGIGGYLECTNPKLIACLKGSQIETIQLTPCKDKQRASQEGGASDEDQGEINDDEIEEKASATNKLYTHQHNQIASYRSANQGVGQFIQDSKATVLNTDNVLTILSAKQIISQRGSKCQCHPLRYESNVHQLLTPQRLPHRLKTQFSPSIITPNRSSTTTCGTYCKFLSSKQQRKIIKNLMKQYAIKNGITDQALMFMNQQNVGAVGEKKYIINSSWWRKWCDYANFGDTMDNTSSYDTFARLDGDLSQRSSPAHPTHFSVYEKPGCIINEPLMKDGKSSQLNSNLIEHFDYEVVCIEVWKHLYSWYSADWCVYRFLTKDKVNRAKIYLDLYPEDNNDCEESQLNIDSD